LRNAELNAQCSYSIIFLGFLSTNKGEKTNNAKSVEIGTLKLKERLLGMLKLCSFPEFGALPSSLPLNWWYDEFFSKVAICAGKIPSTSNS